MNELRQALKSLNSLHANIGNVDVADYKDTLTALHSIKFIVNKLIELLEIQK